MKTASLIILGIIPCIIGINIGEKKRKNAREVSELLSFLKYIQFQVETFLRPQKEIFLLYENKTLEKMGFLPQLKAAVEIDLINGFHKTVSAFSEKFALSKEDKDALISFSGSFGGIPLKRQLEECDRIIKCIEKSKYEKEKDLDSKVKLSVVSGISIGLGIVIILM